MSFPFLSALFALSAAAAWGSGDFTGGIASRRVGAFYTVFLSYLVGLAALVVVALANREALPALADLGWGALAGLFGMAGLGFLLRGFATGLMGIVAPVSASLAAIIPVVITAVSVGLPGLVRLSGFGLALAAVWLLSRPQPFSGRPAGLRWAALAGLGFGLFFTTLDQVSEGALFWPLVAGRAACILVLALSAIAARRPVRIPPVLLGIIALAGILDVAGNLFFLLAIQAGRLDVATVLGSLYPAVTTLLAWWLARERLERIQLAGVALAVLAIVFITL